jgi:hypothetical protein
MEMLLERMTREAEAWAEAGTAKMGDFTPQRGPAPLGSTLEALEEWWYGGTSTELVPLTTPSASVRRAA